MTSIFQGNEAGVSADLYFLQREVRTQAYTSADADILYDGRTYKRETIKRSAISNVFSGDRLQVTMEASVASVFDFLLLGSAHDRLLLTIYQYNITAATALQIFTGAMDSYTLSGGKATVVFHSDGFALDTEFPRALINTTCNHTVYSDQCKLKMESWKIIGKVVRQDDWYAGDTVTSSVVLEDQAPNLFGKWLSDMTDADLAFCMIEYNGVYRVVTAAEPDFVDPANRLMWLDRSFPVGFLKTGDSVAVILGCTRDPEICITRFDNLIHFHGFPYLPWGREAGKAIPLLYGLGKLRLDNTIWEGYGQMIGAVNRTSFWSVVCFGEIEWRYLYGPLIPGGVVEITNPAVRANWIKITNAGYDGTYPVWPPTPSLPLTGRYCNEPRGVAHAYFAWTNQFGPYAILAHGQGTAADVYVEVSRALDESPVVPYWVGTEGVTASGVSPAAVIYDILTNELYGLGMAMSKIDIASFNSASAACAARGFGVNHCWDTVTTARKIIDTVCSTYGLLLSVNAAGKLQLTLLLEATAMVPVRTLTAADISAIELETPSWDKTYNCVYCESDTNLSAHGTPAGQKSRIEVHDQANQLFTGSVRKLKYDAECFQMGEAAFIQEPIYRRMYEILREVSSPKSSGSIRYDLRHADLLPGQVIRVTYAPYSVDGLFRITGRDVPDSDSNTITASIVQISSAQYNTDFVETGDEGRRTGYVNMSASGAELIQFPWSLPKDGLSKVSVNEYKDLAGIYVSWDCPYVSQKFLSTQYLSPADWDVYINDEGAGPGGDHLISVQLNVTRFVAVLGRINAYEDVWVSVAERYY